MSVRSYSKSGSRCAALSDVSCVATAWCPGCFDYASLAADTKTRARLKLAEDLDRKGWVAVHDDEVNDGPRPYCPNCVRQRWPHLSREESPS